MYRKFNSNENKDDDLEGKGDWLLGEDIGKSIPYLRNMANPDKAKYPQPRQYKGDNWADPNDEKSDYGGVHINSGISNRCFFLMSKNIGLFRALRLWFRTLQDLGPTSSFIDFRDQLCKNAFKWEKNKVNESLNKVGLTKSAVSDWRV